MENRRSQIVPKLQFKIGGSGRLSEKVTFEQIHKGGEGIIVWISGKKDSTQMKQHVQRPYDGSEPSIYNKQGSRYGWNRVRGENTKE